MRRISVFLTVLTFIMLSCVPIRVQAETLEEMKERIRQEVADEYGPPPVKQQSGQFRAAPAQEKKQTKAVQQQKRKQPAQKSSDDLSLPFGVSTEAVVRMVSVMMIFAVIPALIARLKGRSFIAWWVLGALFFIFVLPITVFMKSSKTPRSLRPASGTPKIQTAPPQEPSQTAAAEKQPKKIDRPAVEDSNEAVDIYNKIEKLAELKSKGVLTEEEFKAKKNELLSRI